MELFQTSQRGAAKGDKDESHLGNHSHNMVFYKQIAPLKKHRQRAINEVLSPGS